MCFQDKNKRIIESCAKGTLRGANPLQRFLGKQRIGGGITTKFSGLKEQLKLRAGGGRNDDRNRDLDAQEVTFALEFTDWGPFAINISPHMSSTPVEKSNSL